MPWLTESDAARSLGVSMRTLARGISAGMLTSKKEAGRVLVQVRDETSSENPTAPKSTLDSRPLPAEHPPSDIRTRSPETPASSPPPGESGLQEETNPATDTDGSPLVVGESGRSRSGIHRHTDSGHDQALKKVLLLSEITAILALVALVGCVAIAWRHYSTSAAQREEVSRLRQEIAFDREQFDAHAAACESQREASVAELKEIQTSLATASVAPSIATDDINELLKTLEIEHASAADTLDELRDLHPIADATLRMFGLNQEHFTCERSQAELERDQLASEIDALWLELAPRDSQATLEDIINADWEPHEAAKRQRHGSLPQRVDQLSSR